LNVIRIKRNLKLDNIDATNYYKEKVLKITFIYQNRIFPIFSFPFT